VEIAGLADVTVVVLVPEGGDAVQTMKAGLMEIADIFVVNKSDRPGADAFVNDLQQMLAPAFSTGKKVPAILKTVAAHHTGIPALYEEMKKLTGEDRPNDKQVWLLAERAYQLIQQKRMDGIDRQALARQIAREKDFNLYRFVQAFTASKPAV
jgi:LAO/AO transport system kinase